MDCEACTDRLVELLYEEMDEPHAHEARAHLADCESCAATYERLTQGRELASFLVIEEPPSQVRVNVLAAARERANDRAAQRAADPVRASDAGPARAPREEEDSDGGLWSSFVRWVGGFAMGPQVAMAMMLLLMVGIGLWYLPELRRHDPADSHAVVDPAPGDEVGPSAGLQPARPLELAEERGRIRPRETPRQTVRRDGERTTRPQQASTELRTAQVTGRPPTPRPPTPRVLEQPIEGMQPPQVEGSAREMVPSEPPRPQQYAEAPPQPAPMAPSTAPTAPSATSSSTVQYQRGVTRLQQQNYRGAAEDFEALTRRPDIDARRLLPQATHQLARSYAGAGNWPRAIESYQRLLSNHRGYSGAPEAMLELAEAYRRTGQVTQARRILEQASRDARVASRAQRELVRLEAAERAMDRRFDTERTPGPPAPTRAPMLAPESAGAEVGP